MTKKEKPDVQPIEIGKSPYNHVSGQKTLVLVGIIITTIVLLCTLTLLLILHIL